MNKFNAELRKISDAIETLAGMVEDSDNLQEYFAEIPDYHHEVSNDDFYGIVLKALDKQHYVD